MAITKLEVVNQALARLGQEPLLSYDASDDRNATIIRQFYETAKEYVLKLMDPAFATYRASLAQISPAPSFGWTYWYQLPSNFLSIQEVFDATGAPVSKYRLERDRLLTNYGTINIVYTKNVDEGAGFTPEFVSLLYMKLATDIAYPITLSEPTAASIFDAYKLLEDQYPTLDYKGEDFTVVREDEDGWGDAYGTA